MLTNTLLLIIALSLATVLIPVAVIYVLILSIIRLNPWKFWGYMKATILQVAYIIDMLGNVVGRDLFNDWRRTDEGYKFGKRKETISSVLGKNQRDGTLTNTGRYLADLLDLIDPEHCKKSIDDTV